MRLNDWLGGKLFATVQNQHLVYDSCWYDPRVDIQALCIGPSDHLMTLTAAGDNTLAYALAGPQTVYSIDMNPRQNALLELKIAGIETLDYEIFFEIFGQGHFPEIRSVFESFLRERLSPFARQFWDRNIDSYFARSDSFYFCSTSGRCARWINFYIDHIGRFRDDVDALFAAETIEEQGEIWFCRIRKRLLRSWFRLFVNWPLLLTATGIPLSQLEMIKKNSDGRFSQFALRCLDTVFGTIPIRDNYFWRIYLTGRYLKESAPDYLREENFNRLKKGLTQKIQIHTGSLVEFLHQYQGRISRYVLLDHMDWLFGTQQDVLASEWSAMVEKGAPNARFLWRSDSMETDWIDTLTISRNGETVPLGTLLNYHLPWADQLYQRDRTHTYARLFLAELR